MVVRSGKNKHVVAGRVALAGALLAAVAGCSSESGNDVANDGGNDVAAPADGGGNPFEGEAISFVVPFGPGGGYDAYTRTIAPYLEECLGARITVLNEPGAGSILATNKTAIAEPDGTRIQIMNMPGVISSQVAGAEGVEYDLKEFSWIGRIAAPAEVVLAGADSDLKTLEDLVGSSEEVQFVATGPGASDYIAATVFAEAYDIPSKLATGFSGSGEATNAVIAGQADIHIMPYDSELGTMAAGDTRPLVILADEVPKYMDEAPLIADVEAPDADGQELLDSFRTLSETGRSVTAPPGLPEDRLAALREGFTCAMENPELLDKLDTQQRPIDFMEGAEYAELVDEALEPTEAFKTLLEGAF